MCQAILGGGIHGIGGNCAGFGATVSVLGAKCAGFGVAVHSIDGNWASTDGK